MAKKLGVLLFLILMGSVGGCGKNESGNKSVISNLDDDDCEEGFSESPDGECKGEINIVASSITSSTACAGNAECQSNFTRIYTGILSHSKKPSGTSCPAGTTPKKNGKCVLLAGSEGYCTHGGVLDKFGKCIAPIDAEDCKANEVYNHVTLICEAPDNPNGCKADETYNVIKKKCKKIVTPAVECKTGFKLDPVTRKCTKKPVAKTTTTTTTTTTSNIPRFDPSNPNGTSTTNDYDFCPKKGQAFDSELGRCAYPDKDECPICADPTRQRCSPTLGRCVYPYPPEGCPNPSLPRWNKFKGKCVANPPPPPACTSPLVASGNPQTCVPPISCASGRVYLTSTSACESLLTAAQYCQKFNMLYSYQTYGCVSCPGGICPTITSTVGGTNPTTPTNPNGNNNPGGCNPTNYVRNAVGTCVPPPNSCTCSAQNGQTIGNGGRCVCLNGYVQAAGGCGCVQCNGTIVGGVCQPASQCNGELKNGVCVPHCPGYPNEIRGNGGACVCVNSFVRVGGVCTFCNGTVQGGNCRPY